MHVLLLVLCIELYCFFEDNGWGAGWWCLLVAVVTLAVMMTLAVMIFAVSSEATLALAATAFEWNRAADQNNQCQNPLNRTKMVVARHRCLGHTAV